MKKRNAFLVLSALIMGVFSLATLNTAKDVHAEVKNDSVMTSPVAFEESSETKTYYIELQQWWHKDNSGTNIHYWGDEFGTSWPGVLMTKINTALYQYDVPVNANGFMFVRVSGDGTSDWGAKTVNLSHEAAGENNKFTLTNTEVWGDPGATGTWSVYVEEELPPLPDFTPTTYGITDSKVRIWLDRSDFYESGYTIAMKIGSTYYLPTGYEAAIHEGRWFCFYDMPKSVFTGGPQVDLVVYVTDVKEEKVISAGVYVTGDNNKVWKINESGGAYSLSKGAITDRIIPSFFVKVLEGYLTCSSSEENGYNAFPAIDVNFLPRDGEGHWNMEGNLDESKVTDYAGVGTGGYGSDRGDGEEYPAYQKYEALRDMYNANKAAQNLGYVSNKESIVFVIIISLLGITGLAGLYFLRKKKTA